MSLSTSAVAGPSRLPYLARSLVAQAPLSRCYATQQQGRKEAAKDADFEGDGQLIGFTKWINTQGVQFRSAQKGQKAKWLGGQVPYAANPSFRPPPPISDMLQNQISAELRTGQKTVGQISQAFNVSKARVQAVRKLKAVEAEFRRQDIPLQEAFQSSMEDLLGVMSVVDSKTGAIVPELRRREETSRAVHPSNNAELQEEQTHELGGYGSFGNLKDQILHNGLEKDAWEFRSEEQVLDDKIAEAARIAAERKTEAEQVAAEKLRDAEKADLARAPPATFVKPKTGKTVYRFVDTSKLESGDAKK